VVIINSGIVGDGACVYFERQLDRLLEKIFSKQPVKWAWWDVEEGLHSVEWVKRQSLTIKSPKSSDVTLPLMHAVYTIMGHVRTGTISKLMGWESLAFRGCNPTPLLERDVNYGHIRFIAACQVSLDLKNTRGVGIALYLPS